ncbi:MAG: hypothetical protein M0026_20045 [Nocardiopsaceae bacterium]|nr:hypothetical protein [Nocardiopsaceae bacterium]
MPAKDSTETTEEPAAEGTAAPAEAEERGRADAADGDTGGTAAQGTSEEADSAEGAEEAEDDYIAGDGWPLGTPPTAGVVSAETFGIAALLMVAAALVGTRLAEMYASVRAVDQVSALTSVILGDGATALLGVVLGLLSLVLANEASRPWARWAAMAAVVVGTVFVLISVTTYLMVPI